MKSDLNILFTCAGRRNYLINYFRQALGGVGKVFAADMQRSAPALADADQALLVPGIYDASYVPVLQSLIAEHEIDAVISLNDLELPILAAHKAMLEQSGARVIVPGVREIELAGDKWETVRFLHGLGIPTPRTYLDLPSALQAIEAGELAFPVVLKPRWGSASIGIEYPEDIEALELCYRLASRRVGRTILGQLSQQDPEHAILIQEKLQGDEYGLDVLNDLDGNYVGTFARKKLAMRSGETDKAESVCVDALSEVGARIGAALRHPGNLDCDVFFSAGRFYVLELNPRFGGGYPFSHEAGMNTAGAYVAWLHGERDVSRFMAYQAGLVFSKCDRLIRVESDTDIPKKVVSC